MADGRWKQHIRQVHNPRDHVAYYHTHREHYQSSLLTADAIVADMDVKNQTECYHRDCSCAKRLHDEAVPWPVVVEDIGPRGVTVDGIAVSFHTSLANHMESNHIPACDSIPPSC